MYLRVHYLLSFLKLEYAKQKFIKDYGLSCPFNGSQGAEFQPENFLNVFSATKTTVVRGHSHIKSSHSFVSD